MESKVNSYKLTQKTNTYILTTSIQGNEVKLTIKNTISSQVFAHTYTVDTWKRIGSIFESIQTPEDVIQWLHRTLKVHKVKVIEEGGLIKLVFFIKENGIRHKVEIPISEGGQATSTQVSVDTSAFTSIATVDTQDVTAQAEYQTQTQEIAPQEYTATEYQSQSQSQDYLQQGTTTTTTTTTTTNTEVNFSQEFGLDPSKIVSQTPNANTQEIIKSIQDEQKIRLSQVGNIIQGSGETQIDTQFQTQDYQLQADTPNTYTENNFDINQFTTTNTTEVIPEYTTTNVGEEQNIITTQDTTQYTTTEAIPDVTAQYTTEATTDVTAQYTTSEAIPDVTAQYTSSVGTTDVTAQYTTTEAIPDVTAQYTTSETTTDVTAQYTTSEAISDVNAQYTTTTDFDQQNVITTQDTSETQFNFQEYQASTTPEITTQYTETNTQYTNVIDSTPVASTSYSQPFITPADEITTTTNTEIKTETPVDFNIENYTTQNYNNDVNYTDYQATTTTTTTTTTNTQYDTTQFDSTQFANTEFAGYETNVQDDRLIKLEGDTNSLKNEHQQIQNKLSNLMSQITSYKSQLEFLEKEKNSNELNALRAENASIKQQLSELNNLRREAAEVQMLRNKISQMDPLRRKAQELDSLKGQLNELNMLRAKVAELSSMQNQLGELNNLKAQVGQINLMKQQMDELNMLRAKVDELNKAKMAEGAQKEEKEALKRKLEELEKLKMQYEQEIRTLREKKTTTTQVQESSGLQQKQLLFEEKTQQISVKGDIIHTTEELELITRNINKAHKKITLNLLYKATVDGDKAEAFHEKCDQAGSSLVLVETDKGKRFGGFTTCSWAGNCVDKKDEDAFVFSLDKMMVYENIPDEDAIGCYPKFGPIFLGCQIRIYDNAFTKGGTTFEKGLNYNIQENYELNGGERIFGVKEIEVYEVIAQ